jgi:hypothetical protein
MTLPVRISFLFPIPSLQASLVIGGHKIIDYLLILYGSLLAQDSTDSLGFVLPGESGNIASVAGGF